MNHLRPFQSRVLGRCLVLQLLLIASLGTCLIEGNAASPNFIILMTDDQSWVGTSLKMDPDDVRTRSDYFLTPNVERLAKTGMLFNRGYAPAPYCCPTRRSLLIGQTPARHIYQKEQRNWTTRYRLQLSLPQMLKQANPDYRSAHFGKWDMRYDELTPEDMGYDVSDGYTANETGGGKSSGGPAAQVDPKQIFGITQRTCEFMEQQEKSGNPFFVQVSHYAVHLDIYYRDQTLAKVAKMKTGQKHSMAEFAAMTSDVDEGIGILMKKIRSLGLEDSTYIFFLSDNGGRNTMPGQTDRKLPRNFPLRDGKGSVYEGGIRVPFIINGPGVEGGVVSQVPVTGLDIFPTMASLAGYEPELPEALDGGDLTSVMMNSGEGIISRSNPFLFFHQAVARSPETALIMGDHKLVKTWNKNQLELFDLSKDFEEAKDLSLSHPDKVQEMHHLMVSFLNDVDAETRKTGTKSEVYENAKPKP